MPGYQKINDDVLINSFYRLLAEEYGFNEIYEKRDHGVISAILCTNPDYKKEYLGMKTFQFFEKPELMFVYFLVHHCSIAIALHNNQRYFFATPLTQLLIFVDTLQEWERITKIEDQKIRICPCKKIKLEIENEERMRKESYKIIKAIIPYEEPEDIRLKEIFRRFNPEKQYENLVEEFGNAFELERENLNDFFQKGVELRMGQSFKGSNASLRLKICGHCGYTTSRRSSVNNKDMLEDFKCDNMECDS